MSFPRVEDLAPLSGIAMAVLWTLGAVLTRFFDYFPSADRALETFSEQPTRVQRGAILGGFYAVIFLVWFAGSIFSALSDSGGARLGVIAFGGAMICALGLAIGSGIIWVAAAQASRPEGLSPRSALTMHNLSMVMLANVLSIGLAAFIGATGIGSLRIGILPNWFGWTSVIFAIGLLTPVHYIFEGLAVFWIAAPSILLFLMGGAGGLP
jgi:hypothetical protein